MRSAKVFTNGRSQAVRLPKDCRFEDNEVLIQKVGNMVVLMPESEVTYAFVRGLEELGPDFLSDGRPQDDQLERESL